MEDVEQAILLCLAVCAHDGLVSKSEEDELFDLASRAVGIDLDSFNSLVDIFFDSTDSLEALFSMTQYYARLHPFSYWL
ncbi:MAG TPA: hypothetical protein DE179_04180 [Oceanospirillaceae bacterium]|nr:hypothetical protein [Oceanospirillaceae bacterium]